MIETILTSLLDQFRWIRKWKTWVVLLLSSVLFLVGLNLCTSGGVYWLQLLDTYSGGWGILIIGLLECTVLGWIYRADRFFSDIAIMTGRRPALWWRLCWQGFSPLLITFIIFFSWVKYEPAKYGDDYVYPPWADGLGWCMSFASVIWIPVVAVYKLCKEDGGFLERLRYLTLPTREWGPALVKHRRLVDYVQGFVVDPWQTGTAKQPPPTGETNWGYGQLHGNSSQASLSRTASHGSLSRKGSQGSLGRLGYEPPAYNTLTLNQSTATLVSEKSAGAWSHVSYESGV